MLIAIVYSSIQRRLAGGLPQIILVAPIANLNRKDNLQPSWPCVASYEKDRYSPPQPLIFLLVSPLVSQMEYLRSPNTHLVAVADRDILD